MAMRERLTTSAIACASAAASDKVRSASPSASAMSTRPAKARQKRKRQNLAPPKEDNAPPLKLVIRHLPPHLPEEVFLQSVAQWQKSFDKCNYVLGKLATKRDESDQFSRAYIKFKRQNDLQTFIKAYQGHLFVSSSNQHYRALIDLALFQKMAQLQSATAKAKDPLAGTIEQDADYLEFVESLKAPLIRAQQTEVKVESKVTPLIEYLRIQKAKSEARSKARKAKDAAAKAKDQEEKRKNVQALADATSAKMREKSATNGKVSSAKVPGKEHGQNNSTKGKSKAGKPKPTPSTDRPSTDSVPAVKNPSSSKGAPARLPASSLAQQRLPKGQPNNTRPAANVDSKTQDRGTKGPKKSKRKDHKQSENSASAKALKQTGAPIDISGPTPAEMAALAKAAKI